MTPLPRPSRSATPAHRRPRLAAAVAVLVAASACGGGDDDSGAAPGTSSTTAPPSTTTSSAAVAPAPSTTAGTAAPAATTPPPAAPAAPGLDLTGMTVVGPAPTDPAELARLAGELVAAERKVRNPSTPAVELGPAAIAAQTIYRRLSARPEVLPTVLEHIPADLRPVVEANTDAGAELRALAGAPRTSLPPWRIIPPPPAEELERYYREAESRFGVPWAYLASVHLVESRMGRIRGTSTAGAQGPMQFLPSTWEAYGDGGDINDPHDAIMAAARYLQANGAPGDMDNALFNYNRSRRYVRAVTLHAQQMEADRRAYLGYHHWQVFYITTQGDVLLPEGYGA